MYQKCLIEVYNSKIKESEWIYGEVIGKRAGYHDEDFERYDVIAYGIEYYGCHPDCIKIPR